MDKAEDQIERRVNHAVILERIDGRLSNIEKYQDICADDRKALYLKLEQNDKHIGILETKQNGILKGFYVVVVGLIGVFAKIIHSVVHR